MRASQMTDRCVAWDEADGKGRQACAHESRNHRVAFSETAKAGATKERGAPAYVALRRTRSRSPIRPIHGPECRRSARKDINGSHDRPQASQSRVPFWRAPL
jgi:hypothetical protein